MFIVPFQGKNGQKLIIFCGFSGRRNYARKYPFGISRSETAGIDFSFCDVFP
jgi:hypothetical protein